MAPPIESPRLLVRAFTLATAAVFLRLGSDTGPVIGFGGLKYLE